jgi:hypothetical protein
MRSFCITADCAPVAQLDRALPSGGRGPAFESRRVHQNKQPPFRRFFVFGTLPDENGRSTKTSGTFLNSSAGPQGEGRIARVIAAGAPKQTTAISAVFCFVYLWMRTCVRKIGRTADFDVVPATPVGRGQESPSNPILTNINQGFS